MKTFLAVLILALAAAFQALALPLYRLGGAAPDFVLLAVCFLGFFMVAPSRGGAVGSIILPVFLPVAAASFALDLVSLDPIGAHAAALIPPLWLVRRSRRRILAGMEFLRCGLVFAAALLGMSLRVGYLHLRAGSPGLSSMDLLASALYTALLGIPLYAILDPHRHRLGWIRDRRFAGGR